MADEVHVTPLAAEDEIQPKMSLAQFAGISGLSQAAASGLRRWLHVKGYDATGYYALADWQSYYTQMLAS
jgi:hypothetical protein